MTKNSFIVEVTFTKETKVIVCAAQEQALWVNSIKHQIDGQDVSPMCRLCGESGETAIHLSNGCPC